MELSEPNRYGPDRRLVRLSRWTSIDRQAEGFQAGPGQPRPARRHRLRKNSRTEGKATLSRAVAEILDRLGSSAEEWQARLKQLSQGALFGRLFATSCQRLRAAAERLGLKRLPNLGGCPAS
jgi:hypothetical protein